MNENPHAASLALLQEWYATPDDRPPGYWDALAADIAAHPLDFSAAADDGTAVHQAQKSPGDTREGTPGRGLAVYPRVD